MGQPNDSINVGALLEEIEVSNETTQTINKTTDQVSAKVPFAMTPQMIRANEAKQSEKTVSE